MTLEQFAKHAGVKIIACDKEWGGVIGYKSSDYPDTAYCGFRTVQAAYKHWLASTFGGRAGKAVISLLKQAP